MKGHRDRLAQKWPELPGSKASQPRSELDGRMSAETLRDQLLRENKRLSFR